MDRSNIAYLISVAISYDDIGQVVETKTERLIYCNVRSISRDEFFSSGVKGLKPKWTVTMFYPDYNNEEYMKLNNVTYHIYRTYIKQNEEIELYLEDTIGS